MRDTANLMGLPNKNETFNAKDEPTACGAEPTGGCSFTILRFVADNPGAWFFHCHIGTSRPPRVVSPCGAGLRRAAPHRLTRPPRFARPARPCSRTDWHLEMGMAVAFYYVRPTVSAHCPAAAAAAADAAFRPPAQRDIPALVAEPDLNTLQICGKVTPQWLIDWSSGEAGPEQESPELE